MRVGWRELLHLPHGVDLTLKSMFVPPSFQTYFSVASSEGAAGRWSLPAASVLRSWGACAGAQAKKASASVPQTAPTFDHEHDQAAAPCCVVKGKARSHLLCAAARSCWPGTVAQRGCCGLPLRAENGLV